MRATQGYHVYHQLVAHNPQKPIFTLDIVRPYYEEHTLADVVVATYHLRAA